MTVKDNLKYYIGIIFSSILFYKFIDNPLLFFNSLSELIKYFNVFFIALLITLIINPVVRYLENKHNFNRLFCILISYSLILFIFILLFKIIFFSILDMFNTLELDLYMIINNITLSIDNFISTLNLSEYVNTNYIMNYLNSFINTAIDSISSGPDKIYFYIVSFIKTLSNIFIASILSVYIILEKDTLSNNIKNIMYIFLSKHRSNHLIDFYKRSYHVLYGYIVGKLLDSFIVCIVIFIGFKFLLQLENALFLTIIIFFTNLIPYFGPFIGAILPIAINLVINPIKSLWIGLFLLVIQQIDANIIEPKIMSNKIGLSPLFIISSVLIGYLLFGILGIFLSIPIAGILKIFFVEIIKYKNSQNKY